MKILVTGSCGFVGSSIILNINNSKHNNLELFGIDNLTRSGSESNLKRLKKLGVHHIRADIRSQSDVDMLPSVDWIIDCAANPSVLAGADGLTSSRQLIEHNLLGTINLLEYCKRHNAGLTLLSTSRVYSANELASIPVKSLNNRFHVGFSEINGLSDLEYLNLF